MYSRHFLLLEERFEGEYVLYQQNISMKLSLPKISSIISFRLAASWSSMLIKIAPSSDNNLCSSFKRGYIMQSHLSCLLRSSIPTEASLPSACADSVFSSHCFI